MAIFATEGEARVFEKPTTGTVQAVCTTVRDVGVQETTGKFGTKQNRQVVIVFELSQKMTEGEFAGKRFVVSRKFNLTMFEKGLLRPFIESWFAKKFATETDACKFDLEKLIGKNCLLTLVQSEDGKYINIGGISPLMVGMTKMTPELAPNHVYKWIDELAAKAIPQEAQRGSTEAEHTKTPITNATDAELVHMNDTDTDSLDGAPSSVPVDESADVPF